MIQDANRATYDATVSYHHTLVQMRFAVAALFMAAASFLVAAHFADTKWHGYPILLPLLGLLLTFATWAMELRTRSLLANLVAKGLALEASTAVLSGIGFFHLMNGPQPIGIRVPFMELELPNANRVIRTVFSHGFCLNLLYLAFGCFWLNAAWIAYSAPSQQATPNLSVKGTLDQLTSTAVQDCPKRNP